MVRPTDVRLTSESGRQLFSIGLGLPPLDDAEVCGQEGTSWTDGRPGGRSGGESGEGRILQTKMFPWDLPH